MTVIRTDGRVLYDRDRSRVGKMIFEDPRRADNPDLQDVARQIITERCGTTTYSVAPDGGEAVRRGSSGRRPGSTGLRGGSILTSFLVYSAKTQCTSIQHQSK